MTQPIETWLSAYVNSTEFSNKLAHDIDSLEKPAERVKARLELLSYLAPKVKTIDPVTPDQTLETVSITYKVAPPPRAKKSE